MAPPTDRGPAERGSSDDELARLRAENADLRGRVERLETDPGSSRGRVRVVAVGLVMALAAVAFGGATIGVWARRSVLNEQVFAARVMPLARDPAVQAALATRITDEIMTLVDVPALLEDVLPERGRPLSGPLSSAVRGFVADQVAVFLATETFARLWAQVVTQGHAAIVRLLDGESRFVSTTGDTVTINLVPVINQALARIGELTPQLFGRTIDVPALTAGDVAAVVPDAARQRLASALGRPVPEQFGVIEIEGGGEALAAAQQGVQLFNLLVWILVAATIMLIPLAPWLSRRRRRTLLQLAAALVVTTVLVRRLVLTLHTEALGQVQVDANRGAVESVLGQFVDPLLASTTVILWVLVLVAVGALVSGPYRWAVDARDIALRLFTRGAAAVGPVASRTIGDRSLAAGASGDRGDGDVGDDGDDGVVAWARTHQGSLQAGGVSLAVLVLLVFDLSWLGIFILLALLAAWLAAAWWITAGRPDPSTAPSTTGPSTTVDLTAS